MRLQNAKYVNVRGKVDDYNGQRTINVDVAFIVDEPEDASPFIPVAALPVDILEQRVKAHWHSVTDPHLSALLDSILGDTKPGHALMASEDAHRLRHSRNPRRIAQFESAPSALGFPTNLRSSIGWDLRDITLIAIFGMRRPEVYLHS